MIGPLTHYMNKQNPGYTFFPYIHQENMTFWRGAQLPMYVFSTSEVVDSWCISVATFTKKS